MVAGALIRDAETGFAPIPRATCIGKGAYLGGRFVRAVFAALAVLDREPRWVGVDPYNKRIDRKGDDNFARAGND